MQAQIVFDVLVVSQVVFLIIVLITSHGHAHEALGVYSCVMAFTWITGAVVIVLANINSDDYNNMLPVYAMLFVAANLASFDLIATFHQRYKTS